MKLNCKPGDLAILVNNEDGSEGSLFYVVRQDTRNTPRTPGVWWVCETTSPVQTAYGPARTGELVVIHDCVLRPIRDNDGEDETLQWLDVPHKVTA